MRSETIPSTASYSYWNELTETLWGSLHLKMTLLSKHEWLSHTKRISLHCGQHMERLEIINISCGKNIALIVAGGTEKIEEQKILTYSS